MGSSEQLECASLEARVHWLERAQGPGRSGLVVWPSRPLVSGCGRASWNGQESTYVPERNAFLNNWASVCWFSSSSAGRDSAVS